MPESDKSIYWLEFYSNRKPSYNNRFIQTGNFRPRPAFNRIVKYLANQSQKRMEYLPTLGLWPES